MRIGYACKTVGVQNAEIRSLRLQNATPERLRSVIRENLSALRAMLTHNAQNNICLFRISSDIIPFATHPVNKLDWKTEFAEELLDLGHLIDGTGIRVSMHPGQYTVLNSPQEAVVARAISDIEYHSSFLDALGTGRESKVVLHIGGTYGERREALRRFARNYERLNGDVRRRIVLENDEKSFTIVDVLALCHELEIPAVYDSLHHRLNPPKDEREHDDVYWIERCAATWHMFDGRQKIHYSQQDDGKKPGAHSPTIHIAAFLSFVESIRHFDVDIMLEVKDKNLSALKCLHCTEKNVPNAVLEKEWARYKYYVLSRSQRQYEALRELLKDKKHPQPIAFYSAVEYCLALRENIGAQLNAAQHVWGYFKNIATEAQRNKTLTLIDEVSSGRVPSSRLRAHLLRLAHEYNLTYLLQSLYFYLDS